MLAGSLQDTISYPPLPHSMEITIPQEPYTSMEIPYFPI